MLKSAAVKYFGSVERLARAVGVSKFAVYNWPPVVSLPIAFALEDLTNGGLKVRLEVYRDWLAPQTKARREKMSIPKLHVPPAYRSQVNKKALQETA